MHTIFFSLLAGVFSILANVEQGACLCAQVQRMPTAMMPGQIAFCACYSDLHDAARVGDTRRVRRLLDEGARPDERDELFGWTPLHYATTSGHIEIVTLLVDHGADTSVSDVGGTTSLHLAASRHDPELIRLLLQHGADPTVQDHSGLTPLMGLLSRHGGISESSLDAARQLLDAGAKTARQGRAIGPLQLASMHSDERMLSLLVDYGVNVHEIDSEGRTALAVAARAGNRDAVKHFVDLLDVNETDQRRPSPLMLAVSANPIDLEIVSLLLDHGADPNVTDLDGSAALHIASTRANPAVVRALLGAGADPDAQDHAGRTAIDRARESLATLSREVPAIPEVINGEYSARELQINAIRRHRVLRQHQELQGLLHVVLTLWPTGPESQ